MVATQEKKTRKKPEISEAKIIAEYIDYILEQGQQPHSVFHFAKTLKITEEKFYDHFNSFECIEQEIWLGYFTQVNKRLNSDSNYQEFSTREKVLSFYFTLFEVLKGNRSYVTKQLKEISKKELTPNFIILFKDEFSQWIKAIVAEGIESGEIASRPETINKNYDKGFWLQTVFLVNFWIKDTSRSFEKTDAAIEKSVNLGFDLISKGPLDSILDFGKFLFQNKNM